MASKTFKATVNKAGDTMTGNLTVPRIFANDRLIVNPGGSFLITPSTTTYITNISWNFYSGQKRSMFLQYKPVGGADCYRLPENSTENGNKYYDILTSKDPVTLAQGGTGGTDSGWQSYTNSSVFTGTIYYRKVGEFFMIQAKEIKLANTLTVGNSVLLMTLPSAYNPSKEIIPNCFMNTSIVNNRIVPMRLAYNGGLYLYTNKTDDIATTYNLSFSGFGFM